MLRPRVFAPVLIAVLASTAFAGADVAVVDSKGGKEQRITLDEAIDMALKNNLDAEIDRVGVHIARDRIRYAWGAFDPILAINTSRESLETPQNATNVTNAAEAQQLELQQQAFANEQKQFEQQNQTITALNNAAAALAAANNQPAPVPQPLVPVPEFTVTNPANTAPLIFDNENFRMQNQLQGKTPLGTTYGLNLQLSRVAPSLQGSTLPFVTEDSVLASLTLQQPLLRDFGPDANLADVRISRQNHKVATLTWQQTVMNSVATVMNTYFDMVYTQQNIRVREEAIAADQNLVQGNQRRVDVGLMSPIDIRQAQVAMSEDQEILIAAKGQFNERQFALKRVILRDVSPEDTRVFVPNGLKSPAVPPLDPIEWKRTAFENRLDYKIALHQAETENIRLRFARNQMLPKLDLVGSYGLNGLATDMGQAWDRTFQGQAHQWSVGIVASIPLFNVQGRAQLDIAKGLKEQALLKIKQTELTIDVDVDTAISRIKTNLQHVETARQSRRFGEEAMKIQNKRIEQGQVSAFDVIDTQRKLYDARTRELAAKAELDRAIVQLWFSSGTLLDEQHIVIDEGDKRAR